MRVIQSVKEMRSALGERRGLGKAIGLVPTMGALHEAHRLLIRRAREECDLVAVSIFVNPTQFGAGEDLDSYPRPLEEDLALCQAEGVDFVFQPPAGEMYPQGFSTFVEVEGLGRVLCGRSRPTHFRGVTTVVLKLLNIVQPDRAYFGQKDFQQLVIIQRMVDDLNLDVEIVGLPIVREEDGLALSSRNAYLSKAQRQAALSLHRSLQVAERLVAEGERSSSTILAKMRQEMEGQVEIDYVELVDPKTLQPIEVVNGPALAAVAARVGKARLIDNVLVKPKTCINSN